MNIPEPVRYANYNGDVSKSFTIGELKGPNTMNEMMTVVSVEYSSVMDKTRVGFSFIRFEVPDEATTGK